MSLEIAQSYQRIYASKPVSIKDLNISILNQAAKKLGYSHFLSVKDEDMTIFYHTLKNSTTTIH